MSSKEEENFKNAPQSLISYCQHLVSLKTDDQNSYLPKYFGVIALIVDSAGCARLKGN